MWKLRFIHVFIYWVVGIVEVLLEELHRFRICKDKKYQNLDQIHKHDYGMFVLPIKHVSFISH